MHGRSLAGVALRRPRLGHVAVQGQEAEPEIGVDAGHLIQLNAGVSVQVNDIEASSGAFVSTLVTSRANYNFNTRMFVNALLQYNTDARQWSSNMRFNLIHRPLSDIFLVYNDRHDERSGNLIDRALVAKMTYLVAF